MFSGFPNQLGSCLVECQMVHWQGRSRKQSDFGKSFQIICIFQFCKKGELIRKAYNQRAKVGIENINQHLSLSLSSSFNYVVGRLIFGKRVFTGISCENHAYNLVIKQLLLKIYGKPDSRVPFTLLGIQFRLNVKIK